MLAVDVPAAPGVYYLLTRTGRLSYVGKAANLRRRLGDHARDARWERITDVRWEVLSSDAAAIAREADVIVALQPARNRAIRRDEFYSFVTVGRRGRLELGPTATTGASLISVRGRTPSRDGRASTVSSRSTT